MQMRTATARQDPHACRRRHHRAACVFTTRREENFPSPHHSPHSSVLTDLPLPPHATNQRPQLDGPRLVAVLRRGGRATTLHIGATVVHLSALTAELTPNRRTPTSLPVIHLPGVRGRSGVAHHTRRTDLDADNMASSALQPECSLPPCGPDF